MAMVLFGQNLAAIALAAMAGGCLTSLSSLAAGLAQRDRNLPPDHSRHRRARAMLVAFNTWLLLRASLETARFSAGLWNAGSLNGLTWELKPGRRRPSILLMLVRQRPAGSPDAAAGDGRRYRLRAGGAGRAFAPAAADAGGGGAHRRLDGAGRAESPFIALVAPPSPAA